MVNLGGRKLKRNWFAVRYEDLWFHLFKGLTFQISAGIARTDVFICGGTCSAILTHSFFQKDGLLSPR